jgi:hypothetical protein
MSNDNKSNQQSTPSTPATPVTTGATPATTETSPGSNSRPPATYVPNAGVPFKKGNDSPWKKGDE